MMTKVKICGLSTPETVTAAIEAGADFIGFMVYPPSPRHVEGEVMQYLCTQIPDTVRPVVVMVNPDKALINNTLYHIPNLILQLHGDETPEDVQTIKKTYGCPVIKSIPIETKDDLTMADTYKKIADWLLFDAKGEALPGGNGIAFDWDILEDYDRHTAFMLGGGLNPHNIVDAITRARPDAVDVSSGVESAPGIKDPDKIQAFISAAKSA